MPNDLLGEIHSSTAVTSPDWATFRGEVTGMYLLSGQGGEWDAQHLIREYNRNINSLYKSWTPTEPNATGLFLEPYNAGFSYQGTGDFRDYKWDTYSVAFDGVDEYAANGSDAGMPSGTDARTISLWIKHDGVTNDWGIFFNYGGEVASPTTLVTATSFALGWHGALAKMIVGSYARNASGGSSTTITSGAWHHVAVTYTGGNIVYYLDGVADGTATITIDTAVGDNDEFTIANTVRKYSDYLYDGLIDEVAIFDSALSAAQVLAIYNGGTPESLTPYSPTAWWRMGDLVGGVGGLVTDAAATDSNALYLPGVAANYASTPDSSALDGFGDFTLQLDDVTLPDWTPSTNHSLFNKWEQSPDSKSFSIDLGGGGKLHFLVSFNGTAATVYTSTEAIGVSDGATVSIRILRTGSDIEFWIDSGSGFSQLGTTVSGVATALFDSSASVLMGAVLAGGTAQPVIGSIGRARIWNTATPDSSTSVLDINFALASKDVTSFTATSGQTVTIHTTDIDDPAVIRSITDGVLVNEPTFTTDTP